MKLKIFRLFCLVGMVMGLWIPKLHAQNLTIETNTGKLSFCSGGGGALQVGCNILISEKHYQIHKKEK